MYLNRLLLFCIALISFVFVQAQTPLPTIRIKITNTKNEAIPFATVTIIAVADTNNRQMKVSDSSGATSFQLQQGHYAVQITSVNYKPLEKNVTVKTGDQSFSFSLQPSSSSLNTVVVTASRPLT